MDSRGCPCRAFCFTALCGNGAKASERMLECGEGSTWENWPDTVFCLKIVLLVSVPWVISFLCAVLLSWMDPQGCIWSLLLFFTYGGRKRNQNGRWGSHHRHPHAVGRRREGHSSDLPVRTVCVLLFKDPREKNLWVGDGVLWNANRLCRDWAGLKERVGAGTVKAGRFLHLVFLALVSPSVRTLTCLLPWCSSYTYWIDLNNDFGQ